METLEFKLIRKYFADTYTIGKLYADDHIVCDTLEDKARELHDLNHDGDFDETNEGKVYGKTCIPCGRYRIVMTYWSKHNRMAISILDVPGFTGIRMHSGSTEADTEGCPLVGENKIKGRLINGMRYRIMIDKMVIDALTEGKEVWITITM